MSSNSLKQHLQSATLNMSYLGLRGVSDFGIDQLDLAFRLVRPNFKKWELSTWTRDGVEHYKALRSIGLPPAEIRLEVRGRSSNPIFTCYMSFNPSRLVDPFGIGLCSPLDVSCLVAEVLDRSNLRSRLLGEVDEIKVRRIDIARNLRGIRHPWLYLRNLHPIPRRWCTKATLIAGSSGHLETLSAGSKSGGHVILYDKHAEAPDRAPRGTMRFEVQARTWAGRFGGIETVGDISGFSARRLVKNRLKWFGLESELMYMQTAVDRILDSQYSTRTQIQLLRHLSAQIHGRSPSGTPATVRKYDSLIRDLGIAPVLEGSMEALVTRLDFKSGGEIRIA